MSVNLIGVILQALLTLFHASYSVNSSLSDVCISKLTSTFDSMTNVHDVFYPSETRTHSLVKAGEYFVSLL